MSKASTDGCATSVLTQAGSVRLATCGRSWQTGSRSTTTSDPTARSTIEPRQSSGPPSTLAGAVGMWKAKCASHIPTAPATATRSQSQSKTKPRKLQLSMDEKTGAGQSFPFPASKSYSNLDGFWGSGQCNGGFETLIRGCMLEQGSNGVDDDQWSGSEKISIHRVDCMNPRRHQQGGNFRPDADDDLAQR